MPPLSTGESTKIRRFTFQRAAPATRTRQALESLGRTNLIAGPRPAGVCCPSTRRDVMRTHAISGPVWLLLLAALPFPARAQFQAVAVTPDGGTLAAGGRHRRIHIWNVATGALLAGGETAGAIKGLAWVGGGNRLAVAADDAGVEIWEWTTAGARRTQQLAAPNPAYSVAAAADGRSLAAAGHSGWTILYETKAWRPAGVLFERSNLTCGTAFAPDSSFLTTAGNTFSAWNLGTNSPAWRPRGERPIDEIEAASAQALRWARRTGGEPNAAPYADDIVVAPDGRTVAGVNGVTRHDSGGQNLSLWDAAAGERRWLAHAPGLTCVAFTADGRWLVTGGEDGHLRWWHPADGSPAGETAGHTGAVRNVAPCGTGGELVSAAEDGRVVRWSAIPGRRIREFREHP